MIEMRKQVFMFGFWFTLIGVEKGYVKVVYPGINGPFALFHKKNVDGYRII
jgi:hypothetical protein